MLFVSFSSEGFDDYRIKYDEVAAHYNIEGFTFLLCDSEASHGALQVISSLKLHRSCYVRIMTRYNKT